MWNFDVLGIPRLREMAARDVANADMIIIACHGDRPLPDSVKSWIELWITEGVKSIALVALFDAAHLSSATANEIRGYLAEVGQRSNMEFFSQTDAWPERNILSEGIAPLPSWNSAADNLSNSLEFRRRHENSPHWGINE
jgi:hypothetical protein